MQPDLIEHPAEMNEPTDLRVNTAQSGNMRHRAKIAANCAMAMHQRRIGPDSVVFGQQ
jgi:hypothetical protein